MITINNDGKIVCFTNNDLTFKGMLKGSKNISLTVKGVRATSKDLSRVKIADTRVRITHFKQQKASKGIFVGRKESLVDQRVLD